MNGASEELLAGPRLAEDQRAGVPMARETRSPRHLFAEDRTLTHDRGECGLVHGRCAPNAGGGSGSD